VSGAGSQLGLFGAPPDPALAALRDELASIDMDALRPLDALNLLAGWKKKLGG
jgi:DNA mismatch repair protein MutS